MKYNISDITGGIVRFVFKYRKFWLIPVFVAFILINFVFSEFGIINIISLKMERSDLRSKILQEKHKCDSLKSRIQCLEQDSTEIERLAREYYGMLKPGESLYLYKDTLKSEEK
ncbi:MAG: septum formation initiator family protein [Candidatus Kapabacteria bacterium]|nr:septum formation initiator family protein [Candidatus Kapabacteria bacterium]